MTSIISVALRAQSVFPQALACHKSTWLPTHMTVCATIPGLETGFWALHSYHLQYRCCQDPFPTDGFFLHFLPYKHASETWQSPAFVWAALIICYVSVESLTCHQTPQEGSGHWGPMPSSQRVCCLTFVFIFLSIYGCFLALDWIPTLYVFDWCLVESNMS